MPFGTLVNDAYHSLSIEGYQVCPELIERVRSGAWNPDQNAEDHENRNALAARGYYNAFGSVKASIMKALKESNAGSVSRENHREWYRRLFGSSVTAGIIRAADLAGYRSGPVCSSRKITTAFHTPSAKSRATAPGSHPTSPAVGPAGVGARHQTRGRRSEPCR